MAEWYARKIMNGEMAGGRPITYARTKKVLKRQFSKNEDFYKKIMKTIDVILTQNGYSYLIE